MIILRDCAVIGFFLLVSRLRFVSGLEAIGIFREAYANGSLLLKIMGCCSMPLRERTFGPFLSIMNRSMIVGSRPRFTNFHVWQSRF
jgi:hypothetical protein